MSELTQAYVARLHSRLIRKRLSDAEDLSQEIAYHLAESQETLRQAGAANPEIESLKRIGPDRLLAENLVRARKGLDSKPAWRYLLLPFVILLTYGAIIMMLPRTSPSFWQLFGVASALFPTVFLACLALGAVRSRRLLLLPVFAMFGVFLVLTVGMDAIWGPGGVTEGSAQSRKQIIRGLEKQITQVDAEVTAAKMVMNNGNFSPILLTDEGYRAPSLASNGDDSDGFLPFLVTYEDKNEALRNWRRNGRSFVSHSILQIQEQKDAISHFQNLKPGWSVFLGGLQNTISTCVPEMLKVASVCLAVWLATLLRLQWLRRTWRPERLA